MTMKSPYQFNITQIREMTMHKTHEIIRVAASNGKLCNKACNHNFIIYIQVVQGNVSKPTLPLKADLFFKDLKTGY